MSEKPREQVIDLVQKLLALSHSSNEHEAALAASKAQEILIKYDLSLADISDQTSTAQMQLTIKEKAIYQGAGLVWAGSLAVVVSNNMFCSVVRSNGAYLFIGQSHDIEVASTTYGWVLEQLVGIAKTEFEIYELEYMTAYLENLRMPVAKRHDWFNSFYAGAIRTIGNRMASDLYLAQQSNSRVTALVVRTREAIAVYKRQRFNILVRSRGKSVHDNNAYQRGMSAGQSVHIGQKTRLITRGERPEH